MQARFCCTVVVFVHLNFAKSLRYLIYDYICHPPRLFLPSVSSLCMCNLISLSCCCCCRFVVVVRFVLFKLFFNEIVQILWGFVPYKYPFQLKWFMEWLNYCSSWITWEIRKKLWRIFQFDWSTNESILHSTVLVLSRSFRADFAQQVMRKDKVTVPRVIYIFGNSVIDCPVVTRWLSLHNFQVFVLSNSVLFRYPTRMINFAVQKRWQRTAQEGRVCCVFCDCFTAIMIMHRWQQR